MSFSLLPYIIRLHNQKLILLFMNQNMLLVFKRTFSIDSSFGHPKQMLEIDHNFTHKKFTYEDLWDI